MKAAQITILKANLAEAEAALAITMRELADFELVFQSIRAADARAVARWRAENDSRTRIFPDQEYLIVWLMEQLEKAEAS